MQTNLQNLARRQLGGPWEWLFGISAETMRKLALDAADFEAQLARCKANYDSVLNFAEATFTPEYTQFLEEGFWDYWQYAGEQLNAAIESAQPDYDALVNAIRDATIELELAEVLPVGTWDDIEARANRPGLGAFFFPLLIAAWLAVVTINAVADYYRSLPAVTEAIGNTQVKLESLRIAGNIFATANASKQRSDERYDEWLMAQGLPPVPRDAPFGPAAPDTRNQGAPFDWKSLITPVLIIGGGLVAWKMFNGSKKSSPE